MPQTCEPYPGIIVQTTFSPVALEIDIVRRGGKFKNRAGKMCGNGLYYHFKKGCSLIWPDIVWHRWNELVLKEWLEHKYVGVMGAASSGKTHTMAFAHLFDYYCFPYSTTTIVCSTTERDLENRIWGEMKRLHRDATSRWDYLPGHLIEGKLRIVTDDRSEAQEGRDFRNGVCFPSGTLVDTASGPRLIETIRRGDAVLCASGIGRVTQTIKRTARSLVRISTKDGRSICCTPEHPFFTQFRWKKACELNEGCFMLSPYETMRILRQPTDLSEEVLQSVLQCEMDAQPAGHSSSPIEEAVYCEAQVFEISPGLYESNCRSVSGIPMVIGCQASAFQNYARARNQTHRARRQWAWTNEPREKAIGIAPRWPLELRNQNRQMERQWVPRDLQSGHRAAGIETCNRGGWIHSQQSWPSSQGFEEGRIPIGAWVESVTILESQDFERYGGRDGRVEVYNLEVEGHPSYSVNGLLAHNCGVPCKKGTSYVGISAFVGIKNKRLRICADEASLLPKAFLDSLSNLMKGVPGYTDRKASGIGNPADTLDALGLFCEPAAHLGGWDGGIDQTPVTKVWETRMPDGVCVQLCGSDCPNMVAPKGAAPPYPFLITRDNMEDDAKVWGIDDWHYKMFDDAMMPRGQGSRRVITRQQCLKFHALDEPLWLNANRTRICFLDAAYRGVGGDRCVFGTLDFGAESVAPELLGAHVAQSFINQTPDKDKNRIILALIDLVIIPIVQGTGEPAEDQIVAFVQSACEERHVPQTHFYYDAGMRTSLVQAFARHNWNQCNSIDCGGKPTEDQVSADIDVSCRDYYSKFVTQLWFDVRYIIEANQFRGMTQDVMLEFCAREWKRVGSNKIEVESKEELKKKTGRSPDLADALAIGVFGARQKGFVIKRLGNARKDKNDNAWQRELIRQARLIYQSSQLDHAV